MAGYDTLTMPSHTVHLVPEHDGIVNQQYVGGMNYAHDGMFHGLQSDMSGLQFAPYDLNAFIPSALDDPNSYQPGMFDNFLDPSVPSAESAPVNLDNKLLGFGAPVHKSPVYDATGQTWPRMTAELNGMFCVAEDVFEGDNIGRPLELTCYRRNLFQIGGNIVLSRTARNTIIDQCRQVAIYDLQVTLSATESIEGKATEIISVPWKTAAASGTEEKGGTAPASIPIDLTSNQETDPVFVSIPVAWGRLQFKYATANNGRRKGLQQHYQVQIALTARLEGDGQVIKLAEIQSNPIVVRGRSPKNFDSSKDVPLSERKSDSNRARLSAMMPGPTSPWIEPALSQTSQTYYSQQGFPQSIPDPTNWQPQASPPLVSEPRAKKPASASPMAQRNRASVSQQMWKVEPEDDDGKARSVPRIPTGLSLDEELSGEGSCAATNLSPQIDRRSIHASVASPLDSDDQMYEYFPLSLDDWQAPVDAIYRPHVVHHLRNIPADAKVHASVSMGKPKRYFSQTNDD